MSNLTVPLVLKISTELDNLLDKAFKNSIEDEPGKNPTRTDFIRDILLQSCVSSIKYYTNNQPNFCVKDDILNKVLWTIFSKKAMNDDEVQCFNALQLHDFKPRYRSLVEEIFYLITDKKAAIIYKNHEGFSALHKFDFSLLKALAINNLQLQMDAFNKSISKWNTPQGIAMIDIIYSNPSYHMIGDFREKLSDNGLWITKSSNTIKLPHVIPGLFGDCPTMYCRQLFNISNNGSGPLSYYVTMPDIVK